MTAIELIEVLQKYDPSTLVTIDTLGFARGVFPVDDDRIGDITRFKAPDDERYDCVVLQPSPWP
jgi:hypothetical protein